MSAIITRLKLSYATSCWGLLRRFWDVLARPSLQRNSESITVTFVPTESGQEATQTVQNDTDGTGIIVPSKSGSADAMLAGIGDAFGMVDAQRKRLRAADDIKDGP